MSGRNWTRRSIEELVEAYLRGKKGKATELNFTMVKDLKPIIMGNLDPDSFGKVPVGFMSDSTEGGVGNFWSWYRPKSTSALAYSNYVIPASYCGINTSKCRYENISGTLGYECGPAISGKLRVKTATSEDDIRFQILIFPKDCIFQYVKKVVVMEEDSFANGTWCLVTCDPVNEINSLGYSGDEAIVNRTIYYPERNNRLGDISDFPLPVTMINDSYPYNVLETLGTTGDPRLSVNKEVISGTYDGLYPTDLTLYPGYKSIISAATLSGSSGARTTSFINTVQTNYDGSFEHGGTSRDTNYLALIRIDTGSSASNRLKIESYMFTICRMILDGARSSVITASVIPTFPDIYTETPVYDAELKKAYYTPSGSTELTNMVKYKKEYVTIT